MTSIQPDGVNADVPDLFDFDQTADVTGLFDIGIDTEPSKSTGYCPSHPGADRYELNLLVSQSATLY
jgi:hypothetical protein